MKTEDLLRRENVFSLKKEEKDEFFLEELSKLTEHHKTRCEKYKNILDSLGYEGAESHTDIPYLPAPIFKMTELKSGDAGLKNITSSGTSSDEKSSVSLDAETSYLQQQALVRIGSDFLGENRRNMLIIDSESAFYGKGSLSARAAAMRGFSLFSKKRTFALNGDMSTDVNRITRFFNENEGRKVFIFGLTFLIYDAFYRVLKESGIKANLSNALIIHGGGWKKLADLGISTENFENELRDYFRGPRTVEYYGMAEQTGSIFFRCEEGNFHCSDFSDVLVRDEKTLEILVDGKEGVIQTMSLIPRSYPGHNILTQDRGVLLGRDDCSCGRCGACFRITGRMKNAVLRGCSNVL